MRLVFDIEGDGLLDSVRNIWVVCTHDLDTGEDKWFHGEDPAWKVYLAEATMLIGHFIKGYDLPALERVHGFRPSSKCTVYDTLIMSVVLDYERFGDSGHSIEAWGEYFGVPKNLFDDFSKFSPELLERCQTDVKINVLAWKKLYKEYCEQAARSKYLGTYIKAEHYGLEWSTRAEMHGWPFDREGAVELFDRLDRELDKAHNALSSKLGMKCVAVDKKLGVVEAKKPKWIKSGSYDQHTANWFGVDPWSGYEGEDRMILGSYCRVTFEPLDLGSVADVKMFLYRHGWVPTEWNYKKDKKTGMKVRGPDGKLLKTSPKITEDSLEFLGGDGKLYMEYLTARSRHSVVKTWLENVDDKGMLHGSCITIGTPSMRSRHQVIANVPTADAPWGKEMRSLFTTLPGWKIVGCDSASNQARGLAYYLGDKDYIHTLIHGDIHTYNANILTEIAFDLGMTDPVTRPKAKRILYAFLFGASGEKLWSYAYGSMEQQRGNKLKNGFIKAVPGFKELIDKLENTYGKTSKYGNGYIYSLAGNKIYVDSFHKLLVYLLQAFEKITCTAAVMLIMDRLKEAGIPYIPLIMYHDEADFMVPEEYAEQAAAIGKQAFADGPRLFGVDIMDGGAKIGNNWYEIH